MKKIDLDNAIESGVVLADLSSLWSLKLRLEKSFKKDSKNTKIKNLLHKANEDIKKLEKKLSLLNKKSTKLKKENKSTILKRLAQETKEIYKKADEEFVKVLLTKKSNKSLKDLTPKPKSQETE